MDATGTVPAKASTITITVSTSLPDHGGADRARPQVASAGEQLHLGHHKGIGEFAAPEGDQAGCDHARHEVEDHRESILVVPSGAAAAIP